jgi:hypothetical protein
VYYQNRSDTFTAGLDLEPAVIWHLHCRIKKWGEARAVINVDWYIEPAVI